MLRIIHEGLLAVFLCVVAYFAFSVWMDRFSWRQEMTVIVETPAGEVSGSSVTEIVWRKHQIRFMDGMGWDYDVTGEAVVVEVTPGKYLFALLKGAGTTEYMGSVAAASISGQRGRVIDRALFAEVAEKRGRASGIITVPDYQYPLMVTFEDITDPTTVSRVDPTDLAASFKEGVDLKDVFLEVTKASVSEGGVEGFLPWLEAVGRERSSLLARPERGLVSDQADPKIYQISPSNFAPELYK
ncbi:MAG: hypothetical protein WBN04_03805 [Paracoccaceae bacterium]